MSIRLAREAERRAALLAVADIPGRERAGLDTALAMRQFGVKPAGRVQERTPAADHEMIAATPHFDNAGSGEGT